VLVAKLSKIGSSPLSTCHDPNQVIETKIARRDPSMVMRMARIGSFHQTRLSFMRNLLRRLKSENWQFTRTVWRVNDHGVGVGVFEAKGPERTYSLVAFANDLDPSKRSDRVIAEEWDSTFALFDGVPTEEDIERLSKNVPLQEAGRVSEKEISLSRANRSVRLFNYVRDCLAEGNQPAPVELDKVGYMMRTTAVYGSAKFGAIDRFQIEDRPEFNAPFQAELLSVFLTRWFTVSIVEHMAKVKGGDKAVVLASAIKRRLGVGNSTGLGMAPFLMNHPALLNNWIMCREEALARVRSLDATDEVRVERLKDVLARSIDDATRWQTTHEGQAAKVIEFKNDLELLKIRVDEDSFQGSAPWNELYLWGEKNLTLEGQEFVVSLLIEPHGDIVDGLTDCMAADEWRFFRIDGTVSVGEFKSYFDEHYAWVENTDYSTKESTARFWYASEEKLEPRVGERYDEEGAEREHPLATGRDLSAMRKDLNSFQNKGKLATFLLMHPEHRHVVRRVQINEVHPYSEVQDNLICASMMPIDLLRCKLSFFGATKFDPRSDRWVRITMYQNAPYPDEMADADVDDWVYPTLGAI
jgi:hypothetical protein